MQITIPDHVVFRQLGDETVLADLRQEEYFTLNEVGTRIWALLEATTPVEEIVRTIVAEYQVEEAVARQDVMGLIADLDSTKLIDISS